MSIRNMPYSDSARQQHDRIFCKHEECTWKTWTEETVVFTARNSKTTYRQLVCDACGKRIGKAVRVS